MALGDFGFTLSVLCQFPETVTLVFISILKVIWEFQAFMIEGVLLLILSNFVNSDPRMRFSKKHSLFRDQVKYTIILSSVFFVHMK